MSGSKSYKPRFGIDIRIKPELSKRPRQSVQRCGVKGCTENAEWRVPKTRYDMDDRIWLCRDHLRAHNAEWNFFAGMSEAEIQRHCIDAVIGHRPTWPLGKRAAHDRQARAAQATYSYCFADGFAVFGEAAEPTRPVRPTRLTKGQSDALAIMGLEDSATLIEVKARYKELVKRFHPDTNGGNRGTEERLKQVIKAYGHLRATGFIRSVR